MSINQTEVIVTENVVIGEPGIIPNQNRKSPFAFGLGNFGTSILVETFNGYAYFYYIDFLGLAITSAALVRTIFTAWDAINDPLMGFLSDHTRTRWGRRRPWLFPSLPLFMMVFVLVFSAPASYKSTSWLLPYMLMVMLAYETLITIIGINYSALYPELFRTLVERTRVAVFCQSGNVLGLLLGLSLSPLLYGVLGFSRMALIYALVGGSLFFISLWFNRENPASHPQSPWSNIKPIILRILVDRVFWFYTLMMILTLFATGLVSFALPFYVKYALHASTGVTSLLSGAALLSSLATMPVWTRLVNVWKPRRVFLISTCVIGIGILGLGLLPHIPFAVLSAVIFGAALQGINITHIVVRASLISRNIGRTGMQNEATYYGMMNSALRLGGLLQALVMLLAGVIFGYVSGENPGSQPDLAFRYLISAFPLVALFLGGIVGWWFFGLFSPDADLLTAG
ncbi:MAG: MFS transporter [Anaerolineaceae bacterium]